MSTADGRPSKWRNHGAITYAGYILGFPGDTKESIVRDIEIIKRELPLDILEFFFLTPLPGSEDHKVLSQKGVWMDADMNKYDLNHRVVHHPKMSEFALHLIALAKASSPLWNPSMDRLLISISSIYFLELAPLELRRSQEEQQ